MTSPSSPSNRLGLRVKALAIGVLLLGTSADLGVTSVAGAKVPDEDLPAAKASVGIFPSQLKPAQRSVAESRLTTVGVRFTSATAGEVSAIQFFRSSRNVGPQRVQLWDSNGTLLGHGRYSGGSTGWVTVQLKSAVSIQAGRRYVASYTAPQGRYSRTTGVFVPGSPIAAHGLTAYRGLISHNRAKPSQASRSNFFVDIAFTPAGTATPPPTPSPSPEPPGDGSGDLDLPRIAWEGGSSYWSQFPMAKASGWADPSFFPISVFYGKPEHAARLKALGINTYMGAEHDGSRIQTITNQGVSVIAQQEEWTPAEVGSDPGVVGWFISDECEMGYSGCPEDEMGSIAKERQYVAKVKAYADGRFKQANFGNGILRTYWAPSTMDDHVQLMDAASADKYTYTSPHLWSIVPRSPDWPKGASVARAASYGWQVDQMKRFQDPSNPRPIWTFIETAMPLLDEAGAQTITPDQLEGAIWSAIIHEARGVAFFQHNNNGKCGVYSLLDCGSALQSKVTSVTSTIRTLAPVINTQSYEYDFANGTDTMLKTYGGDAYIFADIGLQDSTGSKTFALPSGITGSTVTVVGEGRSIPVVDGKFTDNFASEYTHHIYRITL